MAGSLWDGPQWSCPLIFLPLCNIFPWGWAGPSDSRLINMIWQKWWDITSVVRLEKDCDFYLACSEGSHLPCWELPYGEIHVPRNRYLWPIAARTWTLPVVVSDLESPLLRLEMTVALADTLIAPLWKSLGQRTQLSHIWIPDLQKLWENRCRLF